MIKKFLGHNLRGEIMSSNNMESGHQNLEFYVRKYDEFTSNKRLGKRGFVLEYPGSVLIELGHRDFTEPPSKFQKTIDDTSSTSDVQELTSHTFDDLVILLDFEKGENYQTSVEIEVEKPKRFLGGTKRVKEKVLRSLRKLQIGRAHNMDIILGHESVSMLHASLLYDGEADITDAFYLKPQLSSIHIYREWEKGKHEVRKISEHRTGTKLRLVTDVIIIGQYKFKLYHPDLFYAVLASMLPQLKT
jgi:hypothetical protein